MRRQKRAFVGLAVPLAPLAASAVVASADASAAEPEVTSETSAQFYEMRSPTGETVIARRRLTTTLGASIYDLLGNNENPDAPSLSFRARMRYDADFGGSTAETDVSNFGRLVPGFDRGPIDLMYGYLEGRRFAHGWLNFKLGRQYQTDVLGWWSFDGGDVRVTTPFYLAAEVYGGLEQRGGMPLSTPRFERDGVWRGDRSGYDPSAWPAFQPNDTAPAYGVALESTGFTWLHGRLVYRRVDNTGSSNVSDFANGLAQPETYSGTRVSSERIGYSLDGTLPTVGGLKAGLVYDLYRAELTSIYGSVDVYATKKLTMSLDYDYYLPTFDADSIWNFFMSMPMNDLGLRATYDVTNHASITAAGRAQLFTLQTEDENPPPNPASSPNLVAQNYYPSSNLEAMGGGDLSARWHFGEGSIGAHGAADFAKTGERVGGDLYGQRTLETRYLLTGRLGVWQWDDKERADREATSFQYVVGAGYKLFPRSQFLAEWEHDMNRLVGQRFRVMLYLTLALAK